MTEKPKWWKILKQYKKIWYCEDEDMGSYHREGWFIPKSMVFSLIPKFFKETIQKAKWSKN